MSVNQRMASFLLAWSDGDHEKVFEMLDLAVRYNGPVGIFLGRRRAHAWLRFEQQVYQQNSIEMKMENLVMGDGMKSASCEWCIGPLRYKDVYILNQSILITSVTRIRIPCSYASEKERKDAFQLLTRLMSPVLSKYNPATLPHLDYSYYNIVNPVDLIRVEPRGDFRRVKIESLSVHFMKLAKDYISQEDAQKVAESQKNDQREEVIIMARGKDKEEAAYHFDRAEMNKNRTEEEEKNAILEVEDDTVLQVQSTQYLASGIKLSNNLITKDSEMPNSFDFRIKQLVANAFCMLTFVDLSSNKLTQIPDLFQFPIQTIYLHDNLIDDISEVQKLKSLENLRAVTLYRNPIQDSRPQYKYDILIALNTELDNPPRPFLLRKLDHSVVSPKDKETMKTLYSFSKAERRKS